MITEGKKNKAENYSSYFDPKTSGIVIKSHSSKVSSEKKNINQTIPSVSSEQKMPLESETIVNEPSIDTGNFDEAISSIPDQGYIKECIDALFEEDTINLVHAEDSKIFVTVTSVRPQLKIMLGTTDGLKKLKYYRKKYYKESLKKEEIKDYYDYLTEYVKEEIKPIRQEPRIFREKNIVCYDLCDSTEPKYVVVNKDKENYEIKYDMHPRFRTHDTQCSQPKPEKGGSLDLLDPYLCMVEPDQRQLLKIYIVLTFIPGFVHPLLILDGEAGSGKSTLLHLLKKLIDPTTTGTLEMPEDKEALIINLYEHYFLPYDNLPEEISKDVSNSLCRAVTGTGIELRKKHQSEDKVSRTFKRCIALNGCLFQAFKPDFLSRCLFINMANNKEHNESPEYLNDEFEKNCPKILGAIFDIIHEILISQPSVKLGKTTRLIDFETYGYACAEVLRSGEGKNFIVHYQNCVNELQMRAIEDDPLLYTIYRFVNEKHDWTGTMTNLCFALEEFINESKFIYSKEMKELSAVKLGRKISSCKKLFESQGIIVETLTKTETDRPYRIRKAEIPK